MMFEYSFIIKYLPVQVAILSKYRRPEDSSVFQMIAMSVVGLIVVLVALAIVLRTIGNMFFAVT